MIYVFLAYLAVTAVMSLLAVVAYGWDKRCARLDGGRVPEKTLHLLALFGGWPGALMGQKTFRHKTQKVSFQIVFWMTGALHLVILSALAYVWIR